MQTYTIARTGEAPLKFEGERLAEVSTEIRRGQDQTRWFELDLYRTAGGTYVLRIRFVSRYQDELPTDRVLRCGSPEAVRDELREYDPLRDVVGYPAGDHYREKQARLERQLRATWDDAVARLFEGNEDEFAEVVA